MMIERDETMELYKDIYSLRSQVNTLHKELEFYKSQAGDNYEGESIKVRGASSMAIYDLGRTFIIETTDMDGYKRFESIDFKYVWSDVQERRERLSKMLELFSDHFEIELFSEDGRKIAVKLLENSDEDTHIMD